jgi:hypothetical protein
MTEQEKQAWRSFIKETPAYYPSTPNNGLLARYLHAGGITTTVETLTRACRELQNVLEQRPTAPLNEFSSASVTDPHDEIRQAGYPVRGGLEDGWSYQNRITAWREARAQKAWRDSENARMLAQPPAESTIRRTQVEQKLVAEQQSRFRERQNSETKF